ncbi:MAG: hypothetical protein HY940_07655 [Gammaproteobacteria bacterium]|nr:hypothetical protein [Gammaproteobacteria bacterium]
MATEIDPVINNWYRPADKGHEFRILSIDPVSGLIDIQYFDGDVDEIDLDSWYEGEMELIEQPESWSGAVDVGDIDDYGTEITDTASADWDEPVRAPSGDEDDVSGDEESDEEWASLVELDDEVAEHAL